METPSVDGRKGSSKQAKAKRKPVKVVYISNPMKVKTSASDFRALVQELTGQDSNIGDAARYSEMDTVEEQAVTSVPRVDPYGEAIRSLDSRFEPSLPFDQVFSPPCMHNFDGFIPSTALQYDLDPFQSLQKP